MVMEETLVEKSIPNKPNAASGIEEPRKWNWIHVFFFSLIHVHAAYFIYAVATFQVYFSTILYQILLGQLASLGITAGAHRLWSHRAYKARAPLRIFLAFLHTLTFSSSLFMWTRIHRLHHKYVDTDADPHNSTKGFVFCHVLWILLEFHSEVAKKEKTINMEDLRQDWVIVLQKKHYWLVGFLVAFLLPSLAPVYFWGEDPMLAWCSSLFRCTYTFHLAFSVNSFAHLFGGQPFNRHISARENSFVSHISVGEGWHNYHHTFPWDYRAQEFGHHGYNPTTAFINLCAKLGLAYDLKYPSQELVRKQMARAQGMPDLNKIEIYGWNDTDREEEERKLSKIVD